MLFTSCFDRDIFSIYYFKDAYLNFVFFFIFYTLEIHGTKMGYLEMYCIKKIPPCKFTDLFLVSFIIQ